uniref:Uncharacterized protein n=1 Tax=Anguilla anguilla TaxID=7936 RepID=A0A0E9RKZ6_ANGAN
MPASEAKIGGDPPPANSATLFHRGCFHSPGFSLLHFLTFFCKKPLLFIKATAETQALKNTTTTPHHR